MVSTTPLRTTVRIPTASGDELEAWLYLPERAGPHPAVVMAHGIGAIKAGGLAPFAERFCREGFAAVAFVFPLLLCFNQFPLLFLENLGLLLQQSLDVFLPESTLC